MQWLHGLRTFTIALAFWGSEGGLGGYLMGIRFVQSPLRRVTSVAHSIRVRAGSDGRTVDPGGASALVLFLVCSRVLQTRNRESS